ncbi:MAG: fibronectin type III domain-containing protein [Eubacteriales bacterium]|nr:fibronectin type III domain-containing protein [Eubacteriales bacterium]
MKKALSIFLSLVMLLTVSAGLNITARAEQSVISSFEDATGTLTFSGNGAVSADSYDISGDKIIKIIIEQGITSVQKNAFYNANNLTSIAVYDRNCQISADGILPLNKDDVTFYGFEGSTTQDWATKREFAFKHIYTITFVDYEKNPIGKAVNALEGESAQELAKKAPEFSFPATHNKNGTDTYFKWNPDLSTVSRDSVYAEKQVRNAACVENTVTDKKATCEEEGHYSVYCSRTNTLLRDGTIPKADHVFDDKEEFCIVCHKTKNPNYTTTTTTTATQPSTSTTGASQQPTAPTAPSASSVATSTNAPSVIPSTTKASKPTKNAKKVSGDWVDSKYKKASISKLSKGKKAVTVSWKKVSTIKGYQIQLATDKNFKKNKKTVTVSKQKTTKTTVKKLKAKKKYYVRIRTYKNVKYQGKTIKVYSSWSKVKTVKTK